jgi:hypothetical protein
MNLPRRKFLTVGAGGIALLATAGCDQMPRELRQLLALVKPGGGPFQAPAAEAIDPVIHALNRAGFGARPGDYQRVRKLARTPEAAAAVYLEQQLHPETIQDEDAEYAARRFETLQEPLGELFEYQPGLLHNELMRATVTRAVLSERQLFEMMAQFWSDHFNIDPSKGDCKWLKVVDDRDVIRKHALGKFADLLRASALSPAMLWYLDGRVNRRANPADRPNENYARELLELHTLGVHGGYTQKDVMEVARCLTGWTVRSMGNPPYLQIGKVEFNPALHDFGSKVILAQTVPSTNPALPKDILEQRGRHAAFEHQALPPFYRGQSSRWSRCQSRRCLQQIRRGHPPDLARALPNGRVFAGARQQIQTSIHVCDFRSAHHGRPHRLRYGNHRLPQAHGARAF